MNRNIFIILMLTVLFASCADLFEPNIENIRGKSNIYNEPNFFLGLLTNGYTRIPTNSWSFNDVATDDAVTNDNTNGYLKMATGQWTSSNNAVDRWASCFSGIQYMNIVINEVGKVTFSADTLANKMFRNRIKGEAYGLRALFLYNLLQAHAGWVNGKLLGVPFFLTEQTASSDFNLPRADFNTCTAQIYQDLDSAEICLPLDYVDVTSSTIPAKYTNMGVTDYSLYNRVIGVKFSGLVSGRIVKAIRSQIGLLAASPAFADGTANGSNGTWANAATYAADIVKLNGGVAGLPNYNYGVTWFNNATEINGLTAGQNPKEVIWRSGTSSNTTVETANYPPTLYGNGRINPTQNLVDAFPDANGYPITNASSTYNITNPYTKRDPRLASFIVYNGNQDGPSSTYKVNIETGNDAVNVTSTSTRTGYYMKKLLRLDVNLSPSGTTAQLHYIPRIRYTEIYLNYAEAANEAWGPLADPNGNGFSAYDIIKAIRKRALTLNTDPYLESIKSDQVAMRQLIRNERRLELCFEGFRFWDLRRWKVLLDPNSTDPTMPALNTPAQGITILNGVVSSPVTVETRVYQKYMFYGPIPSSEILKFSKLLQNDGWN